MSHNFWADKVPHSQKESSSRSILSSCLSQQSVPDETLNHHTRWQVTALQDTDHRLQTMAALMCVYVCLCEGDTYRERNYDGVLFFRLEFQLGIVSVLLKKIVIGKSNVTDTLSLVIWQSILIKLTNVNYHDHGIHDQQTCSDQLLKCIVYMHSICVCSQSVSDCQV